MFSIVLFSYLIYSWYYAWSQLQKGLFFMMILCVDSQGEAMVVYDDEAAAKAAIMWYNGM